MDENNDKINLTEAGKTGSAEERSKHRRQKNNVRRQATKPQNTQAPKSEAPKKSGENDKKERTGKRRRQAQSRYEKIRGEKPDGAIRDANENSASIEADEAFNTTDSFADITLSGGGIGGTTEGVYEIASETADLAHDAFKIPDDEILPECLMPHRTTPFSAASGKPDENMTEVVGIRFESGGKTYYFAPGADKFRRGDHAIVETSRGVEYGEISMGNTFVPNETIVQPLRAVGRRATEEDARRNEENHRREKEALAVCTEKISAHGLDMKLVGSSYTFDNTKLIFYFTAPGRVDFRDLVKDLASVFRTRIELRQIGIRDEAKILGGCGVCGRKLCCSSFLPNFTQVSIRMAKEQGLSLSSSKISGCCGRLMCCLRFEHDTYEREIKLTPPVDSVVETADGRGVVTENSPIAGTVRVLLDDKPTDPPKTYRRDSVKVLSRGRLRTEQSDGSNDDSDVLPED